MSERNGTDYTETFSPTARYDSIRILLYIAAQHSLQIMQFNIKTAFLYGDLQEDIYMTPPEGLEVHKNEVLKLRKSLYGIKQAYAKFESLLKRIIFEQSC